MKRIAIWLAVWERKKILEPNRMKFGPITQEWNDSYMVEMIWSQKYGICCCLFTFDAFQSYLGIILWLHFTCIESRRWCRTHSHTRLRNIRESFTPIRQTSMNMYFIQEKKIKIKIMLIIIVLILVTNEFAFQSDLCLK